MRAATLLVFAFLAVFALSAAAAEPVSISVAQSSVAPGASLPRWGTVYLDIAYSADQPLRIQASAFKDGKLAAKGQAMNASVVHAAGSGHALAWVSFSEPAEIDAIRITAYDENFQPLAAIDEPFVARWNAEPAAARTPQLQWVVSLRQQEDRIAAEYTAAHPSEPGFIGTILFILMYLSVPAYFVAQAYCAFRFSGGWRVAALVPLILMAPVLAFTVFAGAAGSNLWPLYLLFAAPFATLYFIGLFAARRTLVAGPFA